MSSTTAGYTILCHGSQGRLLDERLIAAAGLSWEAVQKRMDELLGSTRMTFSFRGTHPSDLDEEVNRG
jgi:hypothetical protein